MPLFTALFLLPGGAQSYLICNFNFIYSILYTVKPDLPGLSGKGIRLDISRCMEYRGTSYTDLHTKLVFLGGLELRPGKSRDR